jgi:hypothetical protein
VVFAGLDQVSRRVLKGILAILTLNGAICSSRFESRESGKGAARAKTRDPELDGAAFPRGRICRLGSHSRRFPHPCESLVLANTATIGHLGMTTFFVLSGFVIYYNYGASERARARDIEYRKTSALIDHDAGTKRSPSMMLLITRGNQSWVIVK